jgi:hypothetical protein
MPVGHASVAHPQHHEGATDLDLYRTFSPSDVGMWSWEAGVPSAFVPTHIVHGQEHGAAHAAVALGSIWHADCIDLGLPQEVLHHTFEHGDSLPRQSSAAVGQVYALA